MNSEELLQIIKKAREDDWEELFLSYEDITELPNEISQLTNLQILSLRGNQLRELPKGITQLQNLQELYIDENQLRNWSEAVVGLKEVEIIVWDGKEHNRIPAEILAKFKTGQELLDYYFKPREIKLNEAKILLIGQGNVGKTSVRQRLMGVKDEDYESKGRTEGVEIKKWAIDVKDEEIKINIWDFGGQEIYHTTHQFFFRSRCLYILVIDARAGERGSQLNYWLRQTHALGRNAPVIVVVNKAEKHDEFDKQQKEFDLRYDEIEKSVKALMENKFTNIAGCVSVSADMNLGFSALVELVRRTIEEKLPAVGTKITREEAAVKELLENETSDYVSGEEFQKLCRDVPEERRKDLVETLDALGVITCFSDVDMLQTIVLKPEWITKGIYKILSSYILGENNGRVNRKDILTIFQENEEDRKKYPPDKIDYILKIMGKRDLCFPETTDRGETELLFPVSFPVKSPNLAPFAENATHFEYQYKNVYFDSIIVRFLRYAYQSLDSEPQKGNYWRRGVEFFTKNKKSRILVKADEVESKIVIKIDGDTSSRRLFFKFHYQQIRRNTREFRRLGV